MTLRAKPREPAIRRLDRYELLEEVGSGGMAVVYRGRDTALDREVAVKLLHPHLAARAESRARFSREARAVARLSHPSIVEIYDYAGDAAVESYLVTEFVRGRTLRGFAEGVGVGFPEVGALLARALADALVHAHAAGVIHRDLKPENVLVHEDGGRRALKLVDFGIARILSLDDRMTMTGALVGSPNHMAPEIVEGKEADARSDVFSLGTILYWLATGALPFAAPNPTAILRRVIEGRFEDPRTGSLLVSDELAEVVSRALAVDPAARFASAAEMRDALDAVLAGTGLADPAAELEAFLSDPPGWKAAFPARLAAALSARAQAALARGQTARALGLWNRVLAVDPGNARVLAELERMERRVRLARFGRRAALAGAALLLLGALGAGALRFRRSRTATAAPPAAPALSVARPAGPSEVEAIPTADADEPTSTADAASIAGTTPPPAPPESQPPPRAPQPAASPRAYVVQVHVRPYAQRALLDGVEVARGTQLVSVELQPGRAHRLQIEHPCCTPFVRDFAAGEAIPQPLELRAALSARPALLRVEAPARARVYVGGKLLGVAGDSQRAPFSVPVPPGDDTPYEGDAEIRIEVDGQPPWATAARLRAGAEVTVVAPEAEADP